MSWLVAASAGLAIAGLPGVLISVAVIGAVCLRRRIRRPPISIRPILIVLLVELRSGRSVLGALQTAARVFPDHHELARSARVATISGLSQAVSIARGEIRVVLAQLGRAQRSGAALGDAVRAMIDADIAAEKARRMARSRSLPVRLMVPVTLLMLPGMVMLLYAPSLLRLFEELSGPLS